MISYLEDWLRAARSLSGVNVLGLAGAAAGSEPGVDPSYGCKGLSIASRGERPVS